MAIYRKLSLHRCLWRKGLESGMRYPLWAVVYQVGWIVLLSTVFSAAQSQAGNSDRATGSCLQRHIPITVLRSDEGRDLQSAQLQVRVDGTSVPILSFARTNVAPRVVLLVDTSSSMAQFSGAEWENGWTAAELALDALPQQSQAALLTFGGDVRFAAFDSKPAVGQALLAAKNMKPHGRTPLFAAVEQSLRLFDTTQFGDAIFIVSDGGDNLGAVNRKALSNELIKRGIRAFAFLMHLPNEAFTPEERQGGPDVVDFVKATGGSIWALGAKWPSGKENSELVTAVRNQIGTPYRLDIALQTSPAKPAKLQIITTARGVELEYPQRIETCWSALPTTNP